LISAPKKATPCEGIHCLLCTMTKQRNNDLETGNEPTFEDDQVDTAARTAAPAVGATTRLLDGTNRDAAVGLDHPIPAADAASSFLPPSAVAEEPSVTPFVAEVQAIHISSTILRDEQMQELQDRLAETERANAALLLEKQAAQKRRCIILAVVVSLALLGGGGVAGWQLGSLNDKGVANAPSPPDRSQAAPSVSPIAPPSGNATDPVEVPTKAPAAATAAPATAPTVRSFAPFAAPVFPFDVIAGASSAIINAPLPRATTATPTAAQSESTGMNGTLVGNPTNMPITMLPILPPPLVPTDPGDRREMLSNEDERPNGNQQL
jgi:hypothetical protein